MLMPSSYRSSYQTRVKLEDELMHDGRLDVDKAIKYVKGIRNNQQLNTFMEFLESEDDLFPYTLYTSRDGELAYLYDVDFDYRRVCESFGDITLDKLDSGLDFFHLKPYKWMSDIAYSLEPITVTQLIQSLRAYQADPDDENFNVRVEKKAEVSTLMMTDSYKKIQRRLHAWMHTRPTLYQVAAFIKCQ